MNPAIAVNLKSSHARRGFSLVEMAIVLTIVAVLMAGLLPKLSGQIEQGRRAETRKVLAEIQQALIGYALMNGHLPCPVNPATQNDPAASAVYGVPDPAGCAGPVAEGYLPWKTLGVPEMDSWGVKRTGSGSLWVGYWRYRVDPNFAASAVPFTLITPSHAINLQVQDNAGTILTSATERPLAIIFSTGPNVTADGENADYETQALAPATYQSDVQGRNAGGSEFDDITVWISRPTLFSRMVQAGKLP